MALSGYGTHDEFWASKYTQGKRTVYGIDLSPVQIVHFVSAPDPSRTQDGNRRVNERHARSFAKYIRDHESWVSPALLLRAPDIFEFVAKEHVAGTDFGVLRVPRTARTDLQILDGQHRILGMHWALEDIARELQDRRAERAQAKRIGQDPAVVAHYDDKITALEAQRQRLDMERVSIQIVVVEDPAEYRQVFVDIADNARGISGAVRARFDSRKVANRALEEVLQHAVLEGHVDTEQDRISKQSDKLLGAKHVVDIIRSVAVGVEGRITARREKELSEAALVEGTNEFLDALLEAFPPLAHFADGDLTARELRAASLLGSTTMLRVLAGVWHELKSRGQDADDITEYFALLGPFMAAPVQEDSPWVKETGVFEVGKSAPTARRQDLKALRDALVDWHEQRPAWLTPTTDRQELTI